MTPFAQQVVLTVLAATLYVLPFLVPALEDAHLLGQLGTAIAAAAWVPRPHEVKGMLERRRERKRRESQPSELRQ